MRPTVSVTNAIGWMLIGCLWSAVPWAGGGAWLWAADVVATEAAELSLSEALEQLRAEGVETVYTSRWVADQRAPKVPAAGPPAERLRELLAPLGLQAREVDEVWVVEPIRASLTGRISSDPGGDPVSGAVVRLQRSGDWATTNDQGYFHFDGLVAGRKVLEISRSGFQTVRHEVKAPAGQSTWLLLSLSLDTVLNEEVMVPAPAPLGLDVIFGDDVGDGARIEQDLLPSLGRISGVLVGEGAMASVRGADPRQMSLILDGVQLVEPYHFRDLGGLAIAIGPNSIGEVRVHRGNPPLIYGDQAAGVVELITQKPDSWAVQLSAGNSVRQLGYRTAETGKADHLLVNGRVGDPEVPSLIGESQLSPTYQDRLAKFSIGLGQHHDMQAQWVHTDDKSFSAHLRPGDDFEWFMIHQSSDHGSLRYQGSFGSGFAEATLYDVGSLRYRRGHEGQPGQFKPQLSPLYPGPEFHFFVLEDRRDTERLGLSGSFVLELSPRWEISIGGDVRSEQTNYDYVHYINLNEPRPNPTTAGQISRLKVESSRQSVFTAGTWRPSPNWTVGLGWRFDRSDLGGNLSSPRVSMAFQLATGVLRAEWSRLYSVANTYDLEWVGSGLLLPEVETTVNYSVGYQVGGRWGEFGVELYGRQLRDPRFRVENLLKPVSRFPEREIDRIVLRPERSRADGLELTFQARPGKWRWRGFYNLARAEDRLDGRWTPRRLDHRHAWSLSAERSMLKDLSLWLAWGGHSGLPTTPFDTEKGAIHFWDGVGAYQSSRLPASHQLDIRLRRSFRWRGLEITPEVGVDNLYDRRSVRGFSLLTLDDRIPELPQELGLGRRFRWGVEISWR